MSERGHAWALGALATDLEFETAAVKLYGKFALAVSDPELHEMFKEFARAESGHMRGLRTVIAAVRTADHRAVFFCPMCGWEIDFGPDPQEGTERKCPMCAGRFAVRLVDGDFVLDRTGP